MYCARLTGKLPGGRCTPAYLPAVPPSHSRPQLKVTSKDEDSFWFVKVLGGVPRKLSPNLMNYSIALQIPGSEVRLGDIC